MRYRELPPDAGRVITSLRDSGYDFNTAVADIVDNSIAAGATLVRIAAVCAPSSGNITVAICDNGCGMDEAGLENAMTYGSAHREDIHSLGKFGLGLKTASTSQCRCVTLVSRKKGTNKASKLVLDIDHAQDTGKWEYIEDAPDRTEMRYLESTAGDSSGTAVIWTKCDRLMGRSYKKPGGSHAQNAFKKKVEELRFHLSMVFQRFVDTRDERARNIRMILNGSDIEPYDPFALALGHTITTYDGEYEGIACPPIHVAAHIVPSRDELDTESQRNKVFPQGIAPDSMQGLYLYRENRLIHWGDWGGLFKSEFHLRLCRIELSFDAEADDVFGIDFQKSKVVIDNSVKEWLLENVLAKARKEANERYRTGVTQSTLRNESVNHSASNKEIAHFQKNDKGRLFSVSNISDTERVVSSSKGRSFIDPITETSNSRIKASIRPVDMLPGNSLWRAGLYNDGGIPRTYVEINVSHDFYQHAYYVCKGNAKAIKCLDYLIWSLGQAEYATKDQASKENYEDMITEVSRTLRILVDDLPQDES